MERKINLRLILIGVLSFLMTALLLVLAFQRMFSVQVRADLRIQTEMLAQCYELTEGAMNWDRFSWQEQRLTVIAPSGVVLYESETDEPLENHLDRQEVQQALQHGVGEASRRSSTLGYDTYYYAIQVRDGTVLRLARNADTAYLLFMQMLPVLLLLLLAVGVLSVVLSRFLTRRLVRPLEQLSEHLDESPLQVPYPELQPFAQALHRQQSRQKELVDMRREFTANVSHELKTPLTSIMGLSEMIENGMARPEDIQTFAHQIHKESNRLLDLISDILNLSRLEELERQEMEPVDLLEVAQESAGRLRFKADQEHVQLTVDGGFCLVQGNAKQLAELCDNLCDNAIRYNRPGGQVIISAIRENDVPVLSVQDTGIGIPEEAQERIFERFYRVDKSRSKETGGTGLGLAIVKHIAMRHGATIQVRSEVGKGTEIRIVFPA